MKYLKFSSRFIVIALFFYIAGASSSLVGTMSSPAQIYTTWDILSFIGTVAVMIILGFMAGTEHEKEKESY